jgi:hypothetical protein
MQPSNIILSMDPERGRYNRVKQFLKEQFGNDQFLINQSTLRVEQELSATKDSYVFDLYEGTQSSDRPLEIKLSRNDLFFATHIAVCLTKQDTSTTPAQYGNFPLYTYPEPNFFAGDDSTNPKEFLALETVYNGSYTFKTKTVERISEMATLHNRFVPEAQYLIAAGSQLEDSLPGYGPTLENRGFKALEPAVVIDGNQNNEFRLELGEGDRSLIAGTVDNAGDAVNTRNVLVLLINGFKVPNASEKVNRWEINV